VALHRGRCDAELLRDIADVPTGDDEFENIRLSKREAVLRTFRANGERVPLAFHKDRVARKLPFTENTRTRVSGDNSPTHPSSSPAASIKRRASGSMWVDQRVAKRR